MTIDHSTFGAETTADEVLEDADLTGKLAFITGGASGLGMETVRALASKGAHIVIAARAISPRAMKRLKRCEKRPAAMPLTLSNVISHRLAPFANAPKRPMRNMIRSIF